jgi:hypothetical protein
VPVALRLDPPPNKKAAKGHFAQARLALFSSWIVRGLPGTMAL